MTGESNAKSGGEEVVYGRDVSISYDASSRTLIATLPKNIKKILGYDIYVLADPVEDTGYSNLGLDFVAPTESGPPETTCLQIAEAPDYRGAWRDPCEVTISGNKIMIQVGEWHDITNTSIGSSAYTYIPE